MCLRDYCELLIWFVYFFRHLTHNKYSVMNMSQASSLSKNSELFRVTAHDSLKAKRDTDVSATN